MKNHIGFCYELVKNQAFWSHNKSVAYNPCSFYDGFIDRNISANQSWFGDNHKKIIEIVNRNEPVPGCHRCYSEEQAGRISRRQSAAQNYENFLHSPDLDSVEVGPEGLDYSVGNLCNLKCVICGPADSSAWIPDYQMMYPEADVSRFSYNKHQQQILTDDQYLQHLKTIHFHGGGEPLLSSAHLDLLQRVKKVRGLGDVRVFYNTNGTQRVSDEVLEIWEQCKLVEIYFSIDDIGHRFEYQRTGARWPDVVENIEWFKINMPHNHMFNINCVWSYLNLYHLDELWHWYETVLPSNRYGDPCNLMFQKVIGPFAINHLSASVIDLLRDKFHNNHTLLSLLKNLKVNNNGHGVFWNMIKKIDHVRHTDFTKVCPEWSKLL